MKPGFAIAANNVNTSIIRGAMLPERGRTLLFNAALGTYFNGAITQINILYPVVGPNQAPGVLFQGQTATGLLCTGYYDYDTNVITDLSGNLLGTETLPYAAFPFTQAVQFLNVVYTNGGQRFFPGWTTGGTLGPATQMYQWQYNAPVVLWDQPPVTGEPPSKPNNIAINWSYAIATTGFGIGGKIQNGDVLTTTINTVGGPQAITYTVGSTVGVPDSSFTILAGHIAEFINAWYSPGGPGALNPAKVTAAVFTNFDVASVPGAATPQNGVGILISSDQSGLVGNSYTVTTSAIGAGGPATENYQIIPPTPPATSTSTVLTANFFGANTNNGNMLGGQYFYLFTRITTMPDSTTSETSVLLDAQAASANPYQTPDTPSYQTYPPRYLNNFFPAAYDAPLQVTLGESTYGSNSAVTFSSGPGDYIWAGTNPDGTTFTTNIYRASSLQDNFVYQFVGNVSVQPTFGGNVGSFTITGTPTTGSDNTYIINGNTVTAPQTTGNTPADQAIADAAVLNAAAPGMPFGPFFAASATGANVVITNFATTGITTTGSSTGGDTLTANQATIGGAATITAFVDMLSDLDISGNAVLTVHRDPPPFVAPSIFTGGGGEGEQSQSFNFGFMGIHQNRVWGLVEVMVPVTSQNAGVNYIYQIPQIQLWLSNIGRGWEFDITNQVILLNANVASYLQSNALIPGTLYYGPDYDANYGNMPKALCEVGTELMASMKREEWVVWGDGTTANPYVAKQAFNYGSLAGSTGTLAVRGGKYFVTESGDVYWYDGAAPQEKSGDINAAVKLTSLGAGLDVADLQSSCLAFSNDTLYWCFPTKGYSYSYDTQSNTWMSQLPYAPTSRYAVASSPWNPATLAAAIPNEVLATRPSLPTAVDQWFSNPNSDLDTGYQLYSWTTPFLDCGHDDWTKWFALVRVMAPPHQPGIVTVSITVDDGDEPQKTFSRSFDLSKSQKSLTKKFMGDTQKIIGYYAQMTVSVQSIPGQPAPVIWGVKVFGSLNSRLRIEDGGA